MSPAMPHGRQTGQAASVHPSQSCDLTKETVVTRTILITFGPASILTRGSDMGVLPEPDFGVWRPLA